MTSSAYRFASMLRRRRLSWRGSPAGFRPLGSLLVLCAGILFAAAVPAAAQCGPTTPGSLDTCFGVDGYRFLDLTGNGGFQAPTVVRPILTGACWLAGTHGRRGQRAPTCSCFGTSRTVVPSIVPSERTASSGRASPPQRPTPSDWWTWTCNRTGRSSWWPGCRHRLAGRTPLRWSGPTPTARWTRRLARAGPFRSDSTRPPTPGAGGPRSSRTAGAERSSLPGRRRAGTPASSPWPG